MTCTRCKDNVDALHPFTCGTPAEQHHWKLCDACLCIVLDYVSYFIRYPDDDYDDEEELPSWFKRQMKE